jgi:hypothetical protein
MGAMGNLMAGSVFVTVDSDYFDPQALQGDDHFLAEFAGTEQHDAGGRGGERGADLHGVSSGRWM